MASQCQLVRGRCLNIIDSISTLNMKNCLFASCYNIRGIKEEDTCKDKDYIPYFLNK